MWDPNYAASVGGSCDISFAPQPESNTNQQVNSEPLNNEQLAAVINVTPERLKEMQDYARKLRKKFPHMTENRIKRKTAEYFKIKLT